MIRIVATVEFVLREENGLEDMTPQELAVEIQDLLEHEHRGLAEYGSAGVTAVTVDRNKE